VALRIVHLFEVRLVGRGFDPLLPSLWNDSPGAEEASSRLDGVRWTISLMSALTRTDQKFASFARWIDLQVEGSSLGGLLLLRGQARARLSVK
jgi:hypothetical protein